MYGCLWNWSSTYYEYTLDTREWAYRRRPVKFIRNALDLRFSHMCARAYMHTWPAQTRAHAHRFATMHAHTYSESRTASRKLVFSNGMASGARVLNHRCADLCVLKYTQTCWCELTNVCRHQCTVGETNNGDKHNVCMKLVVSLIL